MGRNVSLWRKKGGIYNPRGLSLQLACHPQGTYVALWFFTVSGRGVPFQALGLLLCLLAACSVEDRAVLWLPATLHGYCSYANPPLPSLLWALLSISSQSRHRKAAVGDLLRLP